MDNQEVLNLLKEHPLTSMYAGNFEVAFGDPSEYTPMGILDAVLDRIERDILWPNRDWNRLLK